MTPAAFTLIRRALTSRMYHERHRLLTKAAAILRDGGHAIDRLAADRLAGLAQIPAYADFQDAYRAS
jgi:hypothetical protein